MCEGDDVRASSYGLGLSPGQPRPNLTPGYGHIAGSHNKNVNSYLISYEYICSADLCLPFWRESNYKNIVECIF